MFSKRNLQRGFTLVEVIVMATVTTIGLLAILVVADRTLQTSDTNESRVAAVNLSREGIELVRAARDSNWQALSEQQELGTVPVVDQQRWDCYVTDYLQATSVIPSTRKPGGCPPLFGSSGTTAVSYRAFPNVQNGVPYFEVANSANTTDGTFRLCQNQANDAAPIFIPSPTPNANEACPIDADKTDSKIFSGATFYRRVVVQQGKTLPGNTYNLKVTSYVTWLGNKGPEVSMEEYLTDWKK